MALGNNLFAGDNGGNIYRFNGTIWDTVTTGLDNVILSLTKFNNSLFAGSKFQAKIFVTNNNGTTWDLATDTTEQAINCLAEFNNSLFAGSGISGKVYISSNGTTWAEATDTNLYNIYDLASYNNSLFAAATDDITGNNGTIIATTNGLSWDISTTTTIGGYSALGVFNNSLFAGSRTGAGKIYVTNGTGWDLSTSVAGGIYSLAEFNNSLFAGESAGASSHIYKFNGTTWETSTIFGASIFALSTYNNSLFAGTEDSNKIYVTNNGATWDLSTTGPGGRIEALYDTSSTPAPPTPPTAYVLAASDIGFTNARLNGSIVEGTYPVTIRGFTYGTSSNPDLTDNVTSEAIFGSGAGSYNRDISGLSQSTLYYVRAFALTPSDPITYSANNSTFQTLSPNNDMIYGSRQLAQQFSFSKTASLNRVTMNLSRDNTSYTDANIIVEIQTNNTATNVPTGTLYASAKDNFSNLGDKSFYFENRPLIKKDTKYWIVARANDANIDCAYNWSSTTNTDNTRYSAVGNTWSNTTTAAYNFSAFVPHDRFNYQTRQGTISTTVANLSAGEDFFFENIQTDMDRLFNDITVVGRGDGINQVSARALNTQSIALYGRRQQTIEEKSVSTNEDCQSIANNLIARYGEPVTVFDVSMEDPNIDFGMGDLLGITSIVGNLNNSSFRCITQEDYTDMTEDRIRLHLNNAKTSLGTEIDKLKKDKNLQHNYGQGATNLFQVATYENADKDTGEQLDIRFYMPDETKAINKVFLNLKVEAFRAYSSTAAGSSGVVQPFISGAESSEGIGDINIWNTPATDPGNIIQLIAFPPAGVVSGSGTYDQLPFGSSIIDIIYKERQNIDRDGISGYEVDFGVSLQYLGFYTDLTSGITWNGTTPIPVTSTTDFPSSGLIRINNELITYTGKTSTTFTGITRGQNGTRGVPHSSAELVYPAKTITDIGPVTVLAGQEAEVNIPRNDYTNFVIENVSAFDVDDFTDFLILFAADYIWPTDEVSMIATTQALHTHNINFGIFPDPNFGYAGTSPYQAQVSGTDILLDIKAGADGATSLVIENLTVNSSGITDLELTPYINAGVGRWYNVQVFPNVPIRIEANVYSQIYIESK